MFDRDGGLTELIYHIIWWSGCLDGKYESFQNVFFLSEFFTREKKMSAWKLVKWKLHVANK